MPFRGVSCLSWGVVACCPDFFRACFPGIRSSGCRHDGRLCGSHRGDSGLSCHAIWLCCHDGTSAPCTSCAPRYGASCGRHGRLCKCWDGRNRKSCGVDIVNKRQNAIHRRSSILACKSTWRHRTRGIASRGVCSLGQDYAASSMPRRDRPET